ncbi:hypothetical protein MSCa_0530 [Mycoplasma mycoides subsp. mycoides PO-67]|nr:hypothetical protein MSCa_0530 [Mycoplasma mycoides subsp. mycoides PO-67]
MFLLAILILVFFLAIHLFFVKFLNKFQIFYKRTFKKIKKYTIFSYFFKKCLLFIKIDVIFHKKRLEHVCFLA